MERDYRAPRVKYPRRAPNPEFQGAGREPYKMDYIPEDMSIQRAPVEDPTGSLFTPYHRYIEEMNLEGNPRMILGVESGERMPDAGQRHMKRMLPKVEQRMRSLDPSEHDYRLLDEYRGRMSDLLSGQGETRATPGSMGSQIGLEDLELMDDFEKELLLREIELEQQMRQMGY